MSQPPQGPAGPPDPTARPPAHGPVPYPPPPATFAPPPPTGYAPPHPVRPTNTLAIVALVLAFVVPVGGVICGHLARRQIKETGEEGAGMANAALIIGYAFIALFALAICAVLAIVVATRNS